MNLDADRSDEIFSGISYGDNSERPGWVRLSIHPIMTNQEIKFIMDSLQDLVQNIESWKLDYTYNKENNEFEYIGQNQFDEILIEDWFILN